MTWNVCCATQTTCAYAGAPVGAIRFRAAALPPVMALPSRAARRPSAKRQDGATSRIDGMAVAGSVGATNLITVATSLGALETVARRTALPKPDCVDRRADSPAHRQVKPGPGRWPTYFSARPRQLSATRQSVRRAAPDMPLNTASIRRKEPRKRTGNSQSDPVIVTSVAGSAPPTIASNASPYNVNLRGPTPGISASCAPLEGWNSATAVSVASVKTT